MSSTRTARHTWVPAVAGLAGLAYVLKVSLILVSDNTIADPPLVVLYLGGLVLGLIAAVGAGMRQSGALRGVAVGVGSAALLVAWIMGLGEVLEPPLARLSDAVHVQEEVPIMVAGLVLLALAWRARSCDLERSTA